MGALVRPRSVSWKMMCESVARIQGSRDARRRRAEGLMSNSLAPATKVAYERALAPLLQRCPDALDKPWGDEATAAEYFSVYADVEGANEAMLENARAAVAHVHRRNLWREPPTTANPAYFRGFFKALRRECIPKQHRETANGTFTHDQVRALIGFWDSTPQSLGPLCQVARRNAAIAALQYATAARASEVLKCKRENLVPVSGGGYAWTCPHSKTRDDWQRPVPATVGTGVFRIDVAAILGKFLPVAPPLGFIFVSNSGVMRAAGRGGAAAAGLPPLTVDAWLRVIRAGIAKALPPLNPLDYGTHSFRRAAATELGKVATNATCQKLLGHTTQHVWRRYVHVDHAEAQHLMGMVGTKRGNADGAGGAPTTAAWGESSSSSSSSSASSSTLRGAALKR
jgi:integrase